MRFAKLLLAGAAFVLAASCGGGGGGGAADCSPSGTSLSVTAKNLEFSTNCLAAPADQAFQIRFTNSDSGVQHNVAIDDEDEELFHGQIITGPDSVTYDVQALPPGHYSFVCHVHPSQMTGTFVVE